MPMRKKKEMTEEVPAESAQAPVPMEAPGEAPVEPHKVTHRHHHVKPVKAAPAPQESIKMLAVALLGVLVIILAFYFLTGAGFAPGSKVTPDQFKDLLISSQKIYIVMDVRGVQSDITRGNILQCGVDFSSSTFLGSKKEVVPLSIGDKECFSPEGSKTPKECTDMLKDGLTIDIQQGSGGAEYYSNGMVVAIGPEYKVGSCGINMN
jgi:hypothetical protein